MLRTVNIVFILLLTMCVAYTALAQDSLNIKQIGFFNIPGNVRRVFVSNAHAYVVDSDSGLRIIDVSDPTNPVGIGLYDTSTTMADVFVSNDNAYIAERTSGFQILDISNPSAPASVAMYDTPGSAVCVDISGHYAYIADYYSLRIVDISDPINPVEASYCDTNAYFVTGVTVSGNFAYIAHMGYPGIIGGMWIADISNPYSPFIVGKFLASEYPVNLAISDTLAYVTDGDTGLRIIDIRNPATPIEVGTFYVPYIFPSGIAVSNNRAYMVCQGAGLKVIDVSNPGSPTEIGHYSMSCDFLGVAVVGENIFVACQNRGLGIFQGYGPAGVAVDPTQNEKCKIRIIKLRVLGNRIECQLPNAGRVKVDVYNLTGQRVKTLINTDKTAGAFETSWDGRNANGQRASSGVYLVRLEANGQTAAAKMLVVR